MVKTKSFVQTEYICIIIIAIIVVALGILYVADKRIVSYGPASGCKANQTKCYGERGWEGKFICCNKPQTCGYEPSGKPKCNGICNSNQTPCTGTGSFSNTTICCDNSNSLCGFYPAGNFGLSNYPICNPICNSNQTKCDGTGSYSNSSTCCDLGKICNDGGGRSRPYCECTSDSQCSAPRPYCKNGACVECRSNSDCPSGKKCAIGDYCK